MSHDNKPSVGIDVSSRKLDVGVSDAPLVRLLTILNVMIREGQIWRTTVNYT